MVSLQVTLKIGFSTTEENDASNRISFCCLQIFCSLHMKYEKVHSFQCANLKKNQTFLGGHLVGLKTMKLLDQVIT